jgi:hypothetical protein
MFMRHQPTRFMFRDAEPAKVELVLSARDGSPWSLVMTAGTERFIGHYPRLGEMIAAGPLLAYRPVYPAA